MSDNKNMDKMIGELSKRLGVSSDKIRNAAEKGSVDDILKNSKSRDADKINAILKDPEKTKEILNSPQVKALMKILGETGK